VAVRSSPRAWFIGYSDRISEILAVLHRSRALATAGVALGLGLHLLSVGREP
jgi:hypothetical protein